MVFSHHGNFLTFYALVNILTFLYYRMKNLEYFQNQTFLRITGLYIPDKDRIIDKIEERNELLEDLDDTADNLKSKSNNFRKVARKIEHKEEENAACFPSVQRLWIAVSLHACSHILRDTTVIEILYEIWVFQLRIPKVLLIFF